MLNPAPIDAGIVFCAPPRHASDTRPGRPGGATRGGVDAESAHGRVDGRHLMSALCVWHRQPADRPLRPSCDWMEVRGPSSTCCRRPGSSSIMVAQEIHSREGPRQVRDGDKWARFTPFALPARFRSSFRIRVRPGEKACLHASRQPPMSGLGPGPHVRLHGRTWRRARGGARPRREHCRTPSC